MRIAFTGTHSTGKTTLLNALKNAPKFLEYRFADEITRVISKTYKINEFGDDETQRRIMLSHVENIKFDNVIMDRCSLDGYCYTKYLWEKGNVSKEVLDMAREVNDRIVNDYDIIFYLTPDFELTDDGVRSTNAEFRSRVAEIFDEEIRKVTTKVVYLKGTVEERLTTIKNYINE